MMEPSTQTPMVVCMVMLAQLLMPMAHMLIIAHTDMLVILLITIVLQRILVMADGHHTHTLLLQVQATTDIAHTHTDTLLLVTANREDLPMVPIALAAQATPEPMLQILDVSQTAVLDTTPFFSPMAHAEPAVLEKSLMQPEEAVLIQDIQHHTTTPTDIHMDQPLLEMELLYQLLLLKLLRKVRLADQDNS